MESLSETEWDVIIDGTGLQQSLLALALSRSGKNILHVDRDDYYGGYEAALSLQEAENWAERHKEPVTNSVFTAAEIKQSEDGLSSARAYSLALAPQIIHARSDLLEKLVSSKAFRQLEFLAVGSFYIYQASLEGQSLSRIPSTREDVFSTTAISTKAKRGLMKFLKFVLDYKSEAQSAIWAPFTDSPLTEFLATEFKLDEALQSYIVTLTLSLDGLINVADGLGALSRHLSSIGVFGIGFAAVYPKWGGLSEIAQVGCRAGAVGGAVYMLGTGIKAVNTDGDVTSATLSVTLTNEMVVKAKHLLQGPDAIDSDSKQLSRVIAVVDSPLTSLFEVTIEGAPTPSVSTVAFPAGSITTAHGVTSPTPIYAMIHSSDTGECPSGQSVVYLSMMKSESSTKILEAALSSLLQVVAGDSPAGKSLFQLSYNQVGITKTTLSAKGKIASFSPIMLDLAFNDMLLNPVHDAWRCVMGDAIAEGVEYMSFDDREGANDDDDAFES